MLLGELIEAIDGLTERAGVFDVFPSQGCQAGYGLVSTLRRSSVAGQERLTHCRAV